jgi:mannose-1-phosphate guanylyltransferase
LFAFQLTKFFITIGDHPQWKEFIHQQQKELNINIRFVNESGSWGTAGGLLHAEKEIMEDEPSHFFVLHCDITSSFPLQELLDFHKSLGSACTVLGKKVSSDQAHKYGCMVVEQKTHELVHYAEKPETFVSDIINTGIYVFSPRIFGIMRNSKLEMFFLFLF